MASLTYTNQESEEVVIDLLPGLGSSTIVTSLSAPKEMLPDLRIKLLDSYGDMKVSDDGRSLSYQPTVDLRIVYLLSLRKDARAESSSDAASSSDDSLPRKSQLRTTGMKLIRGEYLWLVYPEPGSRLQVDGERVPVLKILREGMDLGLGEEIRLTFREVVREEVSVELRESLDGKDCPYCRTRFEAGDAVVHCPGCGTLQHDECWEDYQDRCSGPPGCPYGVVKAYEI